MFQIERAKQDCQVAELKFCTSLPYAIFALCAASCKLPPPHQVMYDQQALVSKLLVLSLINMSQLNILLQLVAQSLNHHA